MFEFRKEYRALTCTLRLKLEETKERLQRAKIRTSQHLAPAQCRYSTIQTAIDFCDGFYHDKARCCLRDLIQSVLNKCACGLRPEGPKGNRPGRKAGIRLRSDRALKARHHWRFTCRAFGAQFRHILYPGLTAGAIHWRPFGPQTTCALICDALYVLKSSRTRQHLCNILRSKFTLWRFQWASQKALPNATPTR